MSRLHKSSSRALLAGMAVVSLAALVTACGPAPPASAASSGATTPPLSVTWMPSYAAPGTPAQYNKVGVLKVGPSSAKNVLVLEPGTSAGSAYFVPLAKWIVSETPGWQVWSVERRENLLEDQSELNLFKEGKATATQLFDYYLGYLKDPAITHHFQTIPNSTVDFAKSWGMNVAVQDLHTVIGAARKLGGKVVLGGHSLGGTVVTAYATWDFNGQARSRSTGRPRVHRRGQQPHPDGARLRRRARAHDRCAGDPRAPGSRSAVGVAVAELRRDHGALRRSVRRHGVGCRAARSQRALSWPGLRAPSQPTSSHRSGSPTSASTATPSTSRRRPRPSRRPRHTSEKVCRPRARSTGGTAPER